MSGGRIVDPFKMSRFAKKVLELMETEGLPFRSMKSYVGP